MQHILKLIFRTHGVVQGTNTTPCSQIEGGFNSGLVPGFAPNTTSQSPIWSLTVTNTDRMFPDCHLHAKCRSLSHVLNSYILLLPCSHPCIPLFQRHDRVSVAPTVKLTINRLNLSKCSGINVADDVFSTYSSAAKALSGTPTVNYFHTVFLITSDAYLTLANQ